MTQKQVEKLDQMEPKLQNIQLTDIYIYPIKSTIGINLNLSQVEKQGLSGDRRFMVVYQDGKMITARQEKSLLQVNAFIDKLGLKVTSPTQGDLDLEYEQFSMKPLTSQVWSDSFCAYETNIKADLWFSQLLGQPVKLVYTGKQSNRQRVKIQTNVSFADGYPFMLINKASLDDLNRRSSIHHQISQFRPNLVVDAGEAFIEDTWKKIQIGSVIFEVVKPCIRCALTTINPNTNQKYLNNEPLSTLAQFRKDQAGLIYFGQNLIALNEGEIKKEDEVIILETQISPLRTLLDERVNSQADAIKQTYQVELEGKLFTTNRDETILESAEKAGISIANSCRSGLCGACQLFLVEGQVDQENAPALSQLEMDDNKILACCCKAKTDVKIRFK